MAAVDYFLKLDGIPGESTDKSHSKEIELLQCDFGGKNAANVGSQSGGMGSGKVALGAIKLVSVLETSTCKIYAAMCAGTHIKSAVFSFRKAGGTQGDFFTITLGPTMVSACSIKPASSAQANVASASSASSKIGSLDGAALVVEIELMYQTISIAYKAQGADGTLTNAGNAGWDLTKNAPI